MEPAVRLPEPLARCAHGLHTAALTGPRTTLRPLRVGGSAGQAAGTHAGEADTQAACPIFALRCLLLLRAWWRAGLHSVARRVRTDHRGRGNTSDQGRGSGTTPAWPLCLAEQRSPLSLRRPAPQQRGSLAGLRVRAGPGPSAPPRLPSLPPPGHPHPRPGVPAGIFPFPRSRRWKQGFGLKLVPNLHFPSAASLSGRRLSWPWSPFTAVSLRRQIHR